MNRTHSVNRATHICTLVIIDNLNIGGAGVGPDEADAELIVDANAVLTHPVAFERLLPITRRRAQKIQCLGGI
jgi:hypothetical protein